MLARIPRLVALPALLAGVLAPLVAPLAQEGEEAKECLAKTVYFEAKGQSREAMAAIAAVVLNRVSNPEFPDSVCGVVHQGTQRACQFGWHCDGKPDRPREAEEWAKAQSVADAALAGNVRDATQGALYFHPTDLPPPWEIERERTLTIEPFVFYRETAKRAAALAKAREEGGDD